VGEAGKKQDFVGRDVARGVGLGDDLLGSLCAVVVASVASGLTVPMLDRLFVNERNSE
jgi:hypothetical protein